MSAVAGVVNEMDVLGKVERFFLYPFHTDEFEDYKKPILFSDSIERMTYVQDSGKEVLVLPAGSHHRSMIRYEEEVKHYMGLNITMFSLFNVIGQKVEDIKMFRYAI